MISVFFFILWGKEKLAKTVRRAQWALQCEGFSKDKGSWSSTISLQDSSPLTWEIQVGRSGRGYSFLRKKRRARPLHSYWQGRGSFICPFALSQKRLMLHFCTTLNTHLTQAVLCQQQPIFQSTNSPLYCLYQLIQPCEPCAQQSHGSLLV